jgi:hypothetical protein
MERLRAACSVCKLERLASPYGFAEPPDCGGDLLGSFGLAGQFNDQFYRIRRSEPRLRGIGIDELDARGMKLRNRKLRCMKHGARQSEAKEQREPQAHGSIMQGTLQFRS